MIRVHLALFGVLLAIAGQVADTPPLLVAGIAALVPLLVKVFALPARARAGFALSACAAGLVLAAVVAGHAAPVDQPRPVPAACVTGVDR